MVEPDPNLSVTFKADNYTFFTKNLSLYANLTRADGEALTDEDKSGWTIEDKSNNVMQAKDISINSKSGVMTISVTRTDALSLASGTTAVKLIKDGAVYATTNVTYNPTFTITTTSPSKLVTDKNQTITALAINSTQVDDVTDYIFTSQDETIATVNGNIINPLKTGIVTLSIAHKDNPALTGTVNVQFITPAAQVNGTYVARLTDAFNTAANGDTIILNTDVTESVLFSGTVPRAEDFNVTVDLNGHIWSAASGKSYALRVDYGIVTIKDSVGTGGVTYGKDFAFFVGHLAGDYPSKLILESGSFTGKTSVAQTGLSGGTGKNLKYYGGDLVIKGGTFTAIADTNETYDSNGNFKYLLNMLDMNASAYPGGIYSPSSITVEGGTFYKFNPADCAAEGANTNFVAEGYTVTQNGDWYTVTEQ